MDIIGPTRQKTWGLAAVVNFWLGGMSAAAYVLMGTVNVLLQGSFHVSGNWRLSILILMALGFICIALHAGRPGRALFAACRLRSSWMARETVAAGIFIAAVGLQFAFPDLIVAWLTVLGASFFLLSQSMMPYRSLGIGSWGVTVVPILFTLSSFSSGAGLVLLTAPRMGPDVLYLMRMIGLVSAVFNAASWIHYVYRAPVSPPDSLAVLRKWQSQVVVMGGGMLLPVLLLIAGASVAGGAGEASWAWRACEVFAGAALSGGAFLQKYLVIAWAGWWRPLRLGVTA
jgi:hypothetical protein